MSAWLEQRIAALLDEIRAYPTPIARCDEQLAALLDQRSQLIREMNTLETPVCGALALWTNDGGFDAA